MSTRYKLYKDGRFYFLDTDPEEKKPLLTTMITGEAAEAAKVLQATLDEYADARPAALKKQEAEAGAKPAKQKKRKAKQSPAPASAQ